MHKGVLSALYLCLVDFCILLPTCNFPFFKYVSISVHPTVFVSMRELAAERQRDTGNGGVQREGECNLYGSPDTLQHIWKRGTIDPNAVCTHPYSQLKMALIKCHLSNCHVASYGRLGPRPVFCTPACVNTLKIMPFAITSVKICIPCNNCKMSVVNQFK